MTRYVYGPVPSRRLGQSLGVDPIPFKTCNYNCVYCQLGRTRPLVCERGDYVPADAMLEQVAVALERHGPDDIDYVTLVGQGEPTLSASLGRVIRGIQAMTPIPIAVITNGALLCRPEVRQELAGADLVMPSLDAADPETFRRINRPCPRLDIREIVEGMAAFRRCFAGQLWIETMLVNGLNDGEDCLQAIREAMLRIRPDRVQVNVPVRPPAEPWVEAPAYEALMCATALLGDVAEVIEPYEGWFDLDRCGSLAEAVLAVIRRHPMREVRLLETLTRYDPAKVRGTLAQLESSGQARRRIYRGQAFWEAAQVRLGDDGRGTKAG